jgi:hypothetical protein
LNNKYLPLLLILILATFLSFFNYRGIDFSDEYVYSLNAWEIANGVFELTTDTFDNRFGLLLPMAAFVKWFGAKPFIFPIWSFITYCFLLGINFYFVSFYQRKVAIISTLFLGLNPILLELSADVAQDLVLTSFASIPIFILWRTQVIPNRFNFFTCFSFSGTLFFAFTTKMSILLLAPFIAFWFIQDLLKKQNLKFWYTSLLIGIILLLFYFSIYYELKGDFFYRFKGIGVDYYTYPESYGSRPTWELLARVTIFPIPFLLKSYGIGSFVILALIWVIKFDNNKLTKLPNFIFLYFIYLIFIHWFGSMSLENYNPITFSERMWLLLVPPASLLSVFVLEKVLPFIKGYKEKIVIIYFGLIIGLCALGLYLTKDQYPWFILPLIVSILLLIWLKYKNYSFFKKKKYIPHFLVLLPFLILQINVILNYKENTPFFFQKDFLESLKPNETHLIYTDRSLPDMYDIYYEFSPPENIEYRKWETADSSDVSDFDSFYVIYDVKKKIWLEELLGLKIPDFVKDKSIGRYILQNEYLEIKELNIDDLKRIKRVEE